MARDQNSNILEDQAATADATEATQAACEALLAKLVAAGNAAMAASMPVTLASDDTQMAALIAAVAAGGSVATAVTASTLYDGKGSSNALQVAATESAFDLLGTTPDEISLSSSCNAIRLFLMNTTTGQGGHLCVGQFDASDNLLEVVEVTVPTTDQQFATSDDAWGLSSSDEKAKTPISVAFKRNSATSYLKLWMSVSDGGAWYTRYQLYGS